MSSASANDLVDSFEYPTTITTGGVLYQDESYDSRLNLDLPLGGNELFSLGFGYSNVHLADGSLALFSATTGLQSSQTKSFVYGGTIDFWGNEDALTTQKITFNLDYSSEAWQFVFFPAFRRIAVYSEDLSQSNELTTRSRFDVDNYGLDMNLAYIGSNNWAQRLHGSYQYYSQDMRRFDVEKANQDYENIIQQLKDRGLTDRQIDFILNSDLNTLLSVTTLAGLSEETVGNILQLRRGVSQAAYVLDIFSNGLSLSSSFEEYSVGYELGYYWTDWNILFDLSHSRSAVTRQYLNSVTLGTGFSYDDWNSQLFFNAPVDDLSSWILQLSLSLRW